MAYTLSIPILLGTAQIGLTLKAQLVDMSGANVGAAITTGFVEIGLGNYLLTTAIPDGHRGGMKILKSDNTLMAFGAINPEEGENSDTKTSTRVATSGYTAPDNSGISAIKAKTDNLPSDPADESLLIAATDAIMNRLGAPVGASVSADIAAIPTAAEIDTQLSGTHGADSWEGGGGAGSDPLLNEVPGTYASGTAGAALGRIGVAEIEVRAALTPGGDLYLIRGDSYIAEDGRAIEFLDSGDGWPDLAGATASFFAQSLAVEMEIVTPSGSGKKIRLELTSENTTALTAIKSEYAVRLVDADDHLFTLVQGRLIVKEAF
jgi:hypothetical protein